MSGQYAASPPSRPISSASSTASSTLSSGTSSFASRSHDHTLPLPPPRPPTSLESTSGLRVPLGSAPNIPLAAAQIAEVSLLTPRPNGERITNEYVESPFTRQPNGPRLPTGATTTTTTTITTTSTTRSSGGRGGTSVSPRLQSSGAATEAKRSLHCQQQQQQHHLQQQQHRHGRAVDSDHLEAAGRLGQRQPVTKQPVSFIKAPDVVASPTRSAISEATRFSIICERCGYCRCEGCREPPPLPSRWLCNGTCYCSAETAVDYVSCLCCVKGLFYHCADNNQNATSIDSEEIAGNCADEPCSCTGPRTAARWSCLSALTLLLPCLLCYWPARACVAACEACYVRRATQGCRCEPTRISTTIAGRTPPITSRINNDVLLEDPRDSEKQLLPEN